MIADSSRPVLPGSAKNSSGPAPITAWLGDHLGRLEVPLECRVLHELGVAGVGESLAGDRVADEVVGDLQVQPGQVADRVGVLGARQPPDRDRSGVALVFLDESSETRLDRLDDRSPVGLAWLRRRLRGHLPLANHPDDLLPVLEPAAEIQGVRHRLEVDPALGQAASVTRQAMLSKALLQVRRRARQPRCGRAPGR